MYNIKQMTYLLATVVTAGLLVLTMAGPALAKGGRGGGNSNFVGQGSPPAWSQSQMGQDRQGKGAQDKGPPEWAPAWGERQRTGTQTGQTPPPGFQLRGK